jgi:phosphopantetheine--protein transferase-like protein
MLYWYCLCEQDLNNPNQMERPRRWLSSSEWDMYRSFPAPRRQKDWLAGRLAAKRVLQAALQDATGKAPELSSICITNHPNGAPRPSLTDWEDYQEEDFPYHLSISHRDGRGFAAASPKDQGPLGADLERIESRAEGFAEEFFTCEELDWLETTPPSERNAWITVLWSTKEAALKALGMGLTVDTRSLNIKLERFHKELDRNWLPFEVGWDTKRWDAYFERKSQKSLWLIGTNYQNLSDLPVLKGYWRREHGYILSLAYAGLQPLIPEEVHQAW